MASSKPVTVPTFLAALSHARKPEIEDLRSLILSADDAIGEQVKWNAPSFGFDGNDRITFRLQPRDRIELIFHRGPGKRPASDAFTFPDPSGLLKWLAPDRAMIAFASAAEIAERRAALITLIRAWLAATRD